MKLHKCDKSKCEEKKPDEYPLLYSDILEEEGVYKSDCYYSSGKRFVVLRNSEMGSVCLFKSHNRCEVANAHWTKHKFKRLPNAKLIMEVVDE